jgi:membrane protease YdiL (CAAX protease family)
VNFASHWRGHLLLFDARPRAAYPAAAGVRLILAFLLLEAVIGPRFHVLSWLGLPQPEPWIRVAALLALALVLVRLFAGLKLSAIGLVPWRDWSATEKSYFVQILVIANVVFALVIKGPPAHAVTPPQWAAVAVTSFFWGFYQEVVYRGMLQTELTRRFGALAGILAANVAFTFGPLHYYHFATSPPPVAMFVGIFAIGLFFGVLRHRSGNLWLPAVFHGIGTAWILGAA